MNIDRKDAERGLYRKFEVYRIDGRDRPGGKHDGCRYFVLDLEHDPHAIPALKAYAASCRGEFPALAVDLDLIVGKVVRSLMDEELPSIEEMSGIVDDMTEGKSLKDYLEDIRNE